MSYSSSPSTINLTTVERNIFNVLDYGALFNGVADDTSAIQSALTAANAVGGGVVVLPKGHGKYSTVMTTYPGVTVRGQGMNTTFLESTSSSGSLPGGAAFTSGTSTDYIGFEHFQLVGNGEASTSGKGIYLPTGVHSFVKMNNLFITSFPEYGIQVVDPIISSFEDMWIRDCGLDGLFIDIGTSCFLKSIYATGCNRSGIHLRTNTYSHLSNCAAEYATYGYWIESCGNIVMNGNGGEVAMRADAGAAGIVTHVRVQSSRNIVINGQYSTKFAYLNSIPGYHYYITDSTKVLLNAPRGKTILGGDDPGELPTASMHIDAASEVTINGRDFVDDLPFGEVITGSFTNETFSDGQLTEVTGTSQVGIANKGYVANNAGVVVVSLPKSARIGNTFEVIGKGAGGWRLAHGVGKVIHYGAADTSTSLGGSIDSATQYDAIKLLCTTTDTDWTVVSTSGTPVIVAGAPQTFGKATDGASVTASSIVKMILSSFTPTLGSGILTKGTARLFVSAGSANVKFVIYSDVASAPKYKLAESDVLNITNTVEAATDFVFSGKNRINITDSTPYWIGIAFDDPGVPTISISRDNTANLRVEKEGFTWPYLPIDFSTITATFAGPIDAFITYSVVP